MAEFKLDLGRHDRIGLDEAVFCAGKTAPQIAAILASLAPATTGMLLTRLDPDKFSELPPEQKRALDFDPLSRTAFYGAPRPAQDRPPVAIVMAGTSDVPMGREAARTLMFNGQPHRAYTDIGVAGLWRLLDRIEEIREAPVVIVAAGMDAALVSVVGGLVRGAVIGLPTSVGYGVATGGATALNAALASCAPGVAIVNIDNGYGAACAALRIMNLLARSTPPGSTALGREAESPVRRSPA